MTPELLIETERRIIAHWEAGDINALTHIHASEDGDLERWLCTFYAENIRPEDWVMGSHRAHLHALLSGAYTPDELVARVLSGHSMSCHGPRFLTSAIVGGILGLACGIGLSGQRCFAFVGDGCEDSGSFYEAVLFIHGRDLPVQIIIEDNGSSCGVTQEQRGVAKRIEWPPCVIRKRYKPLMPHAGTHVRPQLKSQIPAL